MAIRVRAEAALGLSAPPLAWLHEQFARSLPEEAIPVMLAVSADQVDETLSQCRAGAPIWLELPLDFVNKDEGPSTVARLARAHHKLVLNGAPQSLRNQSSTSAFSLALLAPHETRAMFEKRLVNGLFSGSASAAHRRVPIGQIGCDRIEEIERGFKSGSIACVGWPDHPIVAGSSRSLAAADISTVSEMIFALDRGADVAELEDIVRRDAALSFRLIQMLNSAAYGMRGEVASFRHAVMLLGYAQLRRWLAVILTNSSQDINARPIVFNSFRRGLFLESLAGVESIGKDQGDAFMLGMFSQLDQLFGRPFEQLFDALRVPEPVHLALVKRQGELVPFLRLAEALESTSAEAVAQALEFASVTRTQCNRTLLKVLAKPNLLRGA